MDWNNNKHLRLYNLSISWINIDVILQDDYLNQCWITINWITGKKFSETLIEIYTFSFNWKGSLENGGYFVSASMLKSHQCKRW